VSESVVVFDRVWKKFRVGERHNSLRDLVPSLARRALGKRRATQELAAEEFWALKDVAFEVKPGEAFGIIGRNGAGKSTTLKLLTRILRPTRGRCQVKGRVGALIEIAAGFHGDLTGRENIFLQGAIMGMRRAEIARKLEGIIEFAGVRDFIDTQVKRYSTGMNARLGFAIAAHLDPTVLIIDEVLSVGDMSFQRRCIERMEQFKAEGVAIVFVSHNLQAVASLCDRALHLNSEMMAIGPPDEVIARYVESNEVTAAEQTSTVGISAQLLQAGRPVQVVQPGAELTLRVTYVSKVDLSDYTLLFIMQRSTDQLLVYDGHFDGTEIGQPTLRAGEPTVIDFTFRTHLTRGHYFLELQFLHCPTQVFLGRLRPAANLTVQETRTWGGLADLGVSASVRQSRVPTGCAE
jgi:lipopolysaccharide transport system ATP-binding protein